MIVGNWDEWWFDEYEGCDESAVADLNEKPALLEVPHKAGLPSTDKKLVIHGEEVIVLIDGTALLVVHRVPVTIPVVRFGRDPLNIKVTRQVVVEECWQQTHGSLQASEDEFLG